MNKNSSVIMVSIVFVLHTALYAGNPKDAKTTKKIEVRSRSNEPMRSMKTIREEEKTQKSKELRVIKPNEVVKKETNGRPGKDKRTGKTPGVKNQETSNRNQIKARNQTNKVYERPARKTAGNKR